MKKKILRIFIPIALLFLITESLHTFVPESDKTNSSILKVHIIDVGQGDAILIESDNQYMLIDAGEKGMSNIVIDYLEETGVNELDYVIATHPHSDHIGGLADVIDYYHVDKIIMPDVVHTSKTFENLLDTISENELKITKPIIGNEYTIGEATFVIIAPNSSYYDALNNYSVGIKLIYKENSFIFAGDAEKESEYEMLECGIDLDADVLKLSHHGSTTSSSQRFLDAVTPSIAIVSAGIDNQYGHPHAEILQAIKERKITLYRTDKEGTIILKADGENIVAVTSRQRE
ncbi:MAG: MBL fold metallo-hydrolase [Clostridiales bacterium]|nr:MBL fold metallo-hydrolase [Clostridiales bacterium]